MTHFIVYPHINAQDTRAHHASCATSLAKIAILCRHIGCQISIYLHAKQLKPQPDTAIINFVFAEIIANFSGVLIILKI